MAQVDTTFKLSKLNAVATSWNVSFCAFQKIQENLIYSLTAAAFHSNWPSIHHDPWGLMRLAIPASAAMFGLLPRDACTGSPDRPPPALAVDAITAFAFVALPGAMLALVKPDLVRARWAPTQGGFVGISLVVACRSMFPPGQQPQNTGRFRPDAGRNHLSIYAGSQKP